MASLFAGGNSLFPAGGGAPVTFGTFASTPASGEVGELRVVTDSTGMLGRYSGTAWEWVYPGAGAVTPSTAADWPTWVDQGTSTITDVGGSVLVEFQETATVRGVTRAPPSTPYTVKIAVSVLGASASSSLYVGWRDSSTSRLTHAVLWTGDTGNRGAALQGQRRTGGTFSSWLDPAGATATVWPGVMMPNVLWLTLTDNGTTLSCGYSLDPTSTPCPLFADTRAAWCANPDQIWIGAKAAASRSQLAIRSYAVT